MCAKPLAKTKLNAGGKGVEDLASTRNSRFLAWEHLVGKQWSAEAAAEFYKGPIAEKLKPVFPKPTAFTVLEDNAPSGFKTKRGQEAMGEASISTTDIPKRPLG